MRLSEAARRLSEAGIDDPKGEARRLFVELGGLSLADTVGADPCSDEPRLVEAIRRREGREPLQYILGYADFYRERYKVTGDCLIPRGDTEVLVDIATRLIPNGERFIDLCTGSGCIAISTLKNTRNTTAVAVDLSGAALDIARENAEANGVSDRLTLVKADVLAERTEGEFFAVLSNPPYVTAQAYKTLDAELYFEPEMALVGKDGDGAGFYRRIVELYSGSVKDGGFIAFEIGYDQAAPLTEAASCFGMSCEIIKDLSGNDRVALLKR